MVGYMKRLKKNFYMEAGFCGLVFVFLIAWVVVQPYNVSPDESMRYQIVEYLMKHGTIPHGGDPEIRDFVWGISYAFNPIFAYMLAAVPAKIVSLFTADTFAILVAARMMNVLLGTGMAFLVLRIGRRLFPGVQRWLFAVLIMFLPGTLFAFSYVNNDGLALFSTALMFLMWVRSLEDDWSLKTCIGLAVGIGLCALSYYNAYGVILCSILFFGVTILMCRDKKGDIKFLLFRGALITGIVLILAGWWFVRSYVIYDGDILGMRTSSMYAEVYAQDIYKPSNRPTIQKLGMSIFEMFIYVPGDWEHNWLLTVLISFVGTFGYMTVFMPFLLSKIYILFFGGGLCGLLIRIKETFSLAKERVIKQKRKVGQEILIITVTKKNKYWQKKSVFHWCMLIAAVFPFMLLIYYAYCSEFQAQGRYMLPGIIPLMYFVTYGYGNILNKFIRNEGISKVLYMAASVLVVLGALYTYFGVFLPAC